MRVSGLTELIPFALLMVVIYFPNCITMCHGKRWLPTLETFFNHVIESSIVLVEIIRNICPLEVHIRIISTVNFVAPKRDLSTLKEHLLNPRQLLRILSDEPNVLKLIRHFFWVCRFYWRNKLFNSLLASAIAIALLHTSFFFDHFNSAALSHLFLSACTDKLQSQKHVFSCIHHIRRILWQLLSQCRLRLLPILISSRGLLKVLLHLNRTCLLHLRFFCKRFLLCFL